MQMFHVEQQTAGPQVEVGCEITGVPRGTLNTVILSEARAVAATSFWFAGIQEAQPEWNLESKIALVPHFPFKET